ncbi:MAG: PCMD domain-containing protein [Muribaculaceae bacterium]|nr:PCMD domain-containing protein [Muribaculaceae bacterium]
MKHINTIYSMMILALIAMANSCIKNDIPYPHTQADFVTFVAEGETSAAVIDAKARIVNVYLPEQTNLSAVKIKSYTLTEGAKLISTDLSSPIDLSSDFKVTLAMYYDFEWTIKANRTIERYFTIENQVGSSTIDVVGKRVVAYIPETSSLKNVKVNTIKLGPADVSTMTPNLSGTSVDFTSPVQVYVKYYDTEELWTIYIKKSSETVTTDRVDAWTKVIWAYGTAQVGKKNGFQYRIAGATEWTTVPDEWVTNSGGSFEARIAHVKENTEYQVRAFSDSDYGSEVSVTTDGILEIPNASLDNWWLNDKVWNPWAEGGTSYWDTGNRGAATLGESNSIPTTETWNGKEGYAAMLQTKFVGISVIGKLAAGNLFVGEFVKVDGANGILNLGREFSGRPTSLHGYCKYKTSPINYASTNLSYMKNQPDTAVVYMALTDWAEPYEIRTNPKNQQLFDPNSANVIAYGEVKYGYDINEYTEFKVDLKYRATNRKPKYIVIVCSASKYGDFFTGGSQSVLYLDNFWLEWDYE